MRMLATKPAMARVQHIAAALACKKRITIAKLATELEACPRTIQRDLDFMRDQLHLPIDVDHFGHFFSEPVNFCRSCGRRKRLQKGNS